MQEKPQEKPPETTKVQATEQELTRGKEIYEAKCKMCHRADGKGTMEEMDLTDDVWRNGSSPEDIEKVIREGVKGTGMRAIMGDYTDSDIKALVKYVLKFSETAPAPGADPAPPRPPVPPEAPAPAAPPAPPAPPRPPIPPDAL